MGTLGQRCGYNQVTGVYLAPGLLAWAWPVVSSLVVIQVSAFLSPGNGETDYCPVIT